MKPSNKEQGNYFPSQSLMALFIDIDNFPTGKNGPTISALINALEAWGKVGIRRAYGKSFKSKREIHRELLDYNFEIAEVPCAPNKKNGSDVHIAVEVMNTIYTKRGIKAIVLASGDGDFTSLVNYLHQQQLSVIGVGSRKNSSKRLIQYCDRFLFYEDIAIQKLIRTDSKPVKMGEKAMKTILRKKGIYPPDISSRKLLLPKMIEAAQKIGLPCEFSTLQQAWLALCQQLGVSKTIVRNLIKALLISDSVKTTPQGMPWAKRKVIDIVNLDHIEKAIYHLQIQYLLDEPDLIADPVAIARAIFDDPQKTYEIQKMLLRKE